MEIEVAARIIASPAFTGEAARERWALPSTLLAPLTRTSCHTTGHSSRPCTAAPVTTSLFVVNVGAGFSRHELPERMS